MSHTHSHSHTHWSGQLCLIDFAVCMCFSGSLLELHYKGMQQGRCTAALQICSPANGCSGQVSSLSDCCELSLLNTELMMFCWALAGSESVRFFGMSAAASSAALTVSSLSLMVKLLHDMLMMYVCFSELQSVFSS